MGKRRLIFIHVPKAGGSTLQEIISRQYKEEEIYDIRGKDVRGSIDEFKSLPAERKGNIYCLKGHMRFGLHSEWAEGEATYVTMLREPEDRIISFYYYVIQTADHYLHDALVEQNMSLQEYVTSRLSEELSNGQLRMIAGAAPGEPVSESMLKRAKQNIRSHFSCVGILERFDESIILMKRRLGWKDVSYRKRNVTRGRPSKSEIPEKVLRSIREQNQLDARLYTYAESRLEADLDDIDLNRETRSLRLRCRMRSIKAKLTRFAGQSYRALTSRE